MATLGLDPRLRTDANGDPFRSDGGHYMLDCQTGGIDDPASLAGMLKAITGVVDHGLFINYADSAMTVDEDGEITAHTRSTNRSGKRAAHD